MAYHHPFSPSSAYRWFRCPGSVALCENLPERPSKYADEGTKAHEVAAAMVQDKPVFDVTEEMLNYCGEYKDFIENLKDSDAVMFTELELNSKLFKDFGGTVDNLIFNRAVRELIVTDFKYGKGVPVQADNNLQLLCYAALALELGGYTKEHIDTIRFYIFQPRAPTESPVRGDHGTPTSIAAWVEGSLKPAIAAASAPDAPLHGGDWCKWCKAFGQCTAARDAVSSNAMVLLQDIPAGKAIPPAPESLTPEQIAKTLDFADTLSSWIKAVEANAIHRLSNGEQIAGRKLVRKSTNRRWANIAKAAEVLIAGLGKEAWTKPELISPAQAEKLAVGKAAKAEIQALTVRPEGELTIASSDDKRPSVLPAQAAIATLEAEDSYLR